MTIETRDVGDALKLNIEEINRDMIYSDYLLYDEDNYVDLLGDISKYLKQLDPEYLYSDDSPWVEFFKSNVVEWFGEEHGLVVIDCENWLLSLALVDEKDIKNWDISRIQLEDLESARKLVKFMSIVGEIGSSMMKDVKKK